MKLLPILLFALPLFGGTATFVKRDVTTQGDWKGVYGSDGYSVLGDAASLPPSVRLSAPEALSYTWDAMPPTDKRALARSSAGRIASAWYAYGDAMVIDLNFSDSLQHLVALYCLDWDGGGSRAQTIDILDADSGQVLDSQQVTKLDSGVYVIWKITGHVHIRFTNTGYPSTAVSGIFFDLVPVILNTCGISLSLKNPDGSITWLDCQTFGGNCLPIHQGQYFLMSCFLR